MHGVTVKGLSFPRPTHTDERMRRYGLSIDDVAACLNGPLELRFILPDSSKCEVVGKIRGARYVAWVSFPLQKKPVSVYSIYPEHIGPRNTRPHRRKS